MTDDPVPLRASAGPLTARYDVALLDLDGVLYLGPDPVLHADTALAAARAAGMRLAFVTNNASRTPATVAEHLTSLGVPASPDDVVTSAQAAVRLLREHVPAGSTVLVVGAEGLRAEVLAAGFSLVESADDAPAAVVQGYAAATTYANLAEACLAIQRGAVWVASNVDSTMPTTRGRLPGNGAMVAALEVATGCHPFVAGKPEPALHAESVERTRAQHPLVVGDRTDTDIRGAATVGCDSLLVLTGVATARDLMWIPPGDRPTYLARDLRGLLEPHPAPEQVEGGYRCGGWTVTPDTVAGAGDEIDLLRALCATRWAGGLTRLQPTDNGATAALAALGLAPGPLTIT